MAKKQATKTESKKEESKSSLIAKEDFLWFKAGDKVSGKEEDIAKWQLEGLVE